MKQNRNDRTRAGYYPAKDGEREPGKPPRKRRGAARLALLVCCLGVFALCAVKLTSYFIDIAASKSSTASLKTVYDSSDATEAAAAATSKPEATDATAAAASSTPSMRLTPAQPTATPDDGELWQDYYPSNPRLIISSRFLDLIEKNKDIVGWLTIEGLIDEPVMQRDNEYYLTHTSGGKRSVTGALFLDEDCNLRKADAQLVIHGHNMKEGAMFGSLKKYKVKDASFYKEHPFVTFNTIYEDAQYVIFAVLETDIRIDRHDFLPFWLKPTFSSAVDFDEYIGDVRALSHYDCNVDVRAGDRLLTLATCLGDDDNKRLLVMARRIREGESMLELKTGILTSGDR